MSYIDKKYIDLISNHLDHFKKLQGGEKFNFRCYYCGDSETSSKKTRGYLLPSNNRDSYYYYCHNCSTSRPFKAFLKDVDFSLYQEYIKENISDNPSTKISFKKKDLETIPLKSDAEQAVEALPRLVDLPEPHHARQYCMERKIPKEWLNIIRYTENFKKFINGIVEDKFENVKNADTRLVIPFYDTDKNLFAVTGRALYTTNLKYNMILFDKCHKRIFNLDNVNFTAPYFIVEGPIDCMFLYNAIAAGGSDVLSTVRTLPHKENATIILDNQPRNKDIIKIYDKVIKEKYKIFIWPKNIDWMRIKDINDLIQNGYNISEVHHMLHNNTYSDLTAKLKFSEWKEI